MAETAQYLTLLNTQYKFAYGLTYITKASYEVATEAISILAHKKFFTEREETVIRSIFSIHYNNCFRVKELDAEQPRVIAQKFIGKQKIRLFIFKRDGWLCLKCGTPENLTIDHINPISKGGENVISNLQTLCKSCNSIKRATYKDYRNGAR